MNENVTIRGYRIVADRPKSDRPYSVSDLHLSDHGVIAQEKLLRKVKSEGANCLGREGEFSPPNSSDLPDDETAQKMCEGCPARTECGIFLTVTRQSFGVFAGQVRGRDIPDD